MNITINVELLGLFQEILRCKKLSISIDPVDQSKGSNTVREALKKITNSASEKQMERFSPNLFEYFEKALILVNGREIGLQKGLDTCLKNGDRLTIIPVSHGG